MIQQFLLFCLLSGLGTALHFAVLYVAVEYAGTHVIIASTMGAVVGMLFNYVAHYHLTFGSEAPHRRALPTFLSGGVASIALNALLMSGLLWTGLGYMFAQILTTGFVFVCNFLFARYVAFRT
jgi:putative flippase GtrA